MEWNSSKHSIVVKPNAKKEKIKSSIISWQRMLGKMSSHGNQMKV